MASSTSSAAALLLLSAAALLSLLTTPVSANDRLNAGQFLVGGQSLAQGTYLLTMEKDCDLVLYDNNEAVWSTETEADRKGFFCDLVMQSDGNLVIYGAISVRWASNTNRQDGNYSLLLQKDRNVVIYDNFNNNIWMTGTNVGNAAVVDIPHSNGTAAASGAAQNKVKELYP